jgi:hypothetical protein
MNSNEHPGAYGYQPSQPQPHTAGPRPYQPRFQEAALKSGELVVERKSFHLDLKENHQGRFLRITEKGGTHFNAIIVPAAGLAAFQKTLAEMVAADAGTSPKPPA